MGAIYLEIKACDASVRADPASCETDETKVSEYIDSTQVQMYIISNFKSYVTGEYSDKTVSSKSTWTGYNVVSTKKEAIHWKTSFNTIESEELFLPYTQ